MTQFVRVCNICSNPSSCDAHPSAHGATSKGCHHLTMQWHRISIYFLTVLTRVCRSDHCFINWATALTSRSNLPVRWADSGEGSSAGRIAERHFIADDPCLWRRALQTSQPERAPEIARGREREREQSGRAGIGQGASLMASVIPTAPRRSYQRRTNSQQ